MQFCLGIFGLVAFIIMFVGFPETSHPGTRGIDKLRQSGFVGRRWFPVFVNPLKPLNLLRSPAILSVVRFKLCVGAYWDPDYRHSCLGCCWFLSSSDGLW